MWLDGYASKTEEFVDMSIIFAIAWLQWFVMFFVGPRLYRRYEPTAA